MSRDYDGASGREPEGQKSNSVLDFLYHDAQRIGSFLAQFDDAGHLTQVTQGESAGTKEQGVVSVRGRAGLPGLLGGQLTQTDKAGEEGFETSQRVYDPLWANARTLLDYLHTRQLIHRDLRSATIGQFVLVTGRVEVIDSAMFVNMWDDKKFQALLLSNADEESGKPIPTSSRKGGQRIKMPTPMDIGLMLLRLMPHSIQMTILGEEDKVWCSLLRSGLVCTTGDLLLMHGEQLEGVWHVLGILNCHNHEAVPFPRNAHDEVAAQENSGMVTEAFRAITPFGRMFLGRPSDAYGLTPLMVYREIVT